ncbi:MAG: gamma-glutamylcyclotransferase [Alphaproteobacteria bacterium]|nr:gamma-glutamylcyclotransferase [Alphaproteobacteria bacterium]MCB9794519.1 gamma-glutamylcyclotransferase [Alphaproteobacteria bacterium]
MRGGQYHHVLGASPFLGEARTAPRYTLVSMGAWPAILEGGAQAVAGELYAVDAPTLVDLDALEGAPVEYQRRPVALADGSTALAYVKPPALALGRPVVASGDWRLR